MVCCASIKKSPKANINSPYKNKIKRNHSNNYKIFNIGNSNPTNLTDYIKEIEKNLGKKAKIIFDEMQPGDVEATYANTKSLENWINYKPNTSIDIGIEKFVNWYINYYKNK